MELYEYWLDKKTASGWTTVLTLNLQAEYPALEERMDYLYRHKSTGELILHVQTYRDTPANFAWLVDHGGEHWSNVHIEGRIADYYVSHDDGETWQSITLNREPRASEYVKEELPGQA
jgi:hypothetical protein